MLMRYLGLGVGHLNPADFPHEANIILPEADHRGVDAISGEVIPDDTTRESGDEVKEQELDDDGDDDEGSDDDSHASDEYEY